jgi:hypothetical protein
VNSRSVSYAVVTLAATVPLLLSGCGGGGGGSNDDGKIKGADGTSGAEASASPSASPSATAVGRPKITLPSDLKYEFEWPKTGSKDKDAVLYDTEQFLKASDLAIVHQNSVDKAYLFYSEGYEAASMRKYIQGYVDIKRSVTGLDRFYDATVTVDGTTASARFCEDQSKTFDKSIKTGKIYKTPVDKDSYVLYATDLDKSKSGIWRTERLNSVVGSSQCQP